VLGFAVIMLIPIDIVRELGITASLGVAWMIMTNKMLLPILLSHLTMLQGGGAEEAFAGRRASHSGASPPTAWSAGGATIIVARVGR
jgi:predicted RND superfamily exporter protein